MSIELDDVIKAGYGGILPNVGIVDRRLHPEAFPIPANPSLGVPEPAAVEAPEHKERH